MSERCYRRQPISGHQDLRILFFNELGPREGSTAVAFPPPETHPTCWFYCIFYIVKIHTTNVATKRIALLRRRVPISATKWQPD